MHSATTKFTPRECVKCARALPTRPQGGRPTRFCSDGCKRSAEAEMGRLNTVLRKLTEGYYVGLINGAALAGRDAAIQAAQARYDHLAGVPQ